MFERVKSDIYSRLVSERQELVRMDGSRSNMRSFFVLHVSVWTEDIAVLSHAQLCDKLIH
jgi:hypothetical protein